jgi:hypothetical protein
MATNVVSEEIAALEAELDAAERDARALVNGLSEEQGTWRAEPGSWSVAECLEHLATASRVYLRAFEAPAAEARETGRVRRRAAKPGLIGGLFVRSFEPPVRKLFKMKAPRLIRPRPGPSLGDAFTAFLASQNEVRGFLREYAGIDLAGVKFPNPFIRGLRFSLATGLHVIPAHQRRHLWQARRVREAALRARVGA